MTQFKNLTELYDAYKDEPPDRILDRISAFFVEAGKYYRRGYVTEEEFYLMTYYDTVYNTLCGLKNNIYVDWKLLDRNQDFKDSWTQWKETGKIQIIFLIYNNRFMMRTRSKPVLTLGK